MNKKFSTLLTTALFFSGALFSEAYAEKITEYIESAPATKVEKGVKYVLVQDRVSGGKTQVAVGMEYDIDTKKVTYHAISSQNENGVTESTLDQYTWTVEESTTTFGTIVTFKNEKTGLYLAIKTDDDYYSLVDSYEGLSSSDYSNEWVWPNYVTYEKATTKCLVAAYPNIKGKSNYFLNYDATEIWKTTVSASISGQGTFSLYKIKDQNVSDTELNELYNSTGFNFKIKDGVDNIFADQKIKAIKVNDPLYSDDSESFGFPEGTYFVTETPAGPVPEEDSKLYDYLLNSTFIALSASDNASTSADKQKNGEGFTLTTVKGKDLNLFISTVPSVIASTPASQQTSGSTISVLNAAFTVKKNVNNAGKYALSLNRVRIQEKAGDAKHVEKSVILDIKSDASYNSDEVLVSYPSTTQSFIFEFVASNVVEGKEFLNENGAAIYNIQFVGSDADGLYLTSAYNAGSIANFAKGIAIADLNTPAFQYVVTKVDGNNVTFTNRETGKAFTAQLFEEEGTDTYSLALGANSDTKDFTILNIKDNGNIEPAEATDLDLAWVKLTKVASVDKFAGFLNVEDEAKMTLTFARDLDPTSNKIYPVVEYDNNGDPSDWAAKMTDNVDEAAQWQLLKSKQPLYTTYTYAYIDADDKVAYKSKGDTVAYYTYEFELVNDGLATGYKIANTDYALTENADQTFTIKENVDGSVNIVTTLARGAKNYLNVSNYNDAELKNFDRSLKAIETIQEIAATDIKTYLVQDAPEVSLSADASYVTLKSELGNYVAMTGERDGIIVNNDPVTFRVFATDLKSVVPSFYVTTGWNAEDGSRMFLFNPADSVEYYVGAGTYDKEYQWAENTTKAIFKSGVLNASLDTLATSIKGKDVNVAMKADNAGVQGGLNYFKYQIILADAAEADDLYVIRTLADAEYGRYLYSVNDKLCWTSERSQALKFYIDNVEAPTANEAISAGNVVVAGTNGAVVVKGAEGKNVIVSTILGKVVANEVVSSDNAQIATPAGIVVVSVDGESFKVVVK